MLPMFYSIPRSLCTCLLNSAADVSNGGCAPHTALGKLFRSSFATLLLFPPSERDRGGGGGGFCVSTTRRQHILARFITLSSRYPVSVSNFQPRRSLIEATPAILENSSLIKKNTNPCHDYLCIVISVFYYLVLILLFIFLQLLFSVTLFSYIFPTKLCSKHTHIFTHTF